MTNPSKAKGHDAENAVAEFFRDAAWPYADRMVQHGNKDMGDITGLPFVCEVKDDKSFDVPGWLRELDVEMNNAGVVNGVLVVKRRGSRNVGNWYFIMQGDDWCALANEAGWT